MPLAPKVNNCEGGIAQRSPKPLKLLRPGSMRVIIENGCRGKFRLHEFLRPCFWELLSFDGGNLAG